MQKAELCGEEKIRRSSAAKKNRLAQPVVPPKINLSDSSFSSGEFNLNLSSDDESFSLPKPSLVSSAAVVPVSLAPARGALMSSVASVTTISMVLQPYLQWLQ